MCWGMVAVRRGTLAHPTTTWRPASGTLAHRHCLTGGLSTLTGPPFAACCAPDSPQVAMIPALASDSYYATKITSTVIAR